MGQEGRFQDVEDVMKITPRRASQSRVAMRHKDPIDVGRRHRHAPAKILRPVGRVSLPEAYLLR